MKCPKCSYLGFETGDRCQNCGYEFSLMIDASLVPVEPDMPLRPQSDAASAALGSPAAAPPPARSAGAGRALPLFGKDELGQEDLDAPLIRVPAAPRPPLAVRRTPVPPPRPRSSPATPRSCPDEPVLSFEAETAPPARHDLRMREEVHEAAAPAPVPSDDAAGGGSPLAPRAVAGLIDHGILVGIDIVVLYFTLRMTGLAFDDWSVLPLAPLLTFLGFVKVAYFGTFTAVGGQTIGKMATRLRVVGPDRGPVSVPRGLWRAVAGLLSILPFGVGLIPILLSAEHRAFHDRVTGTRVVSI